MVVNRHHHLFKLIGDAKEKRSLHLVNLHSRRKFHIFISQRFVRNLAHPNLLDRAHIEDATEEQRDRQ